LAANLVCEYAQRELFGVLRNPKQSLGIRGDHGLSAAGRPTMLRSRISISGRNRTQEETVELKEVKMYSDYKSPFAYLAFDPAFELPQRYRIRLRWIPFQLRIRGKGERSQYSEYKARYSYLDARRWAKPRGLLIRGPLKVYDTRPALIGGLYAESQGRLMDYSRRAFELFFHREFEADQADAVAALIERLGMSGHAYRDYFDGAGAIEYDRAQAEAAQDNVFGVPLFFFEREPFWGHDRIPVLEERLTEAGLLLNH
jgi:2-hydroxychromene-2-carboxylate isomerase